jgi:hypothetical protein
MLPNLIIPGAPKAATTSLAHYLNTSKEVFFKEGECKFFYSDKKYNKGLHYYENLFHPDSEVKIIGEVSNIYMYSDKAIARIKSDLPNVKFLVCLRDPVKRAFSQYNYAREKGTEFLPFKTAIKLESIRRKIPHRFFKNNYAYLYRGNYSVFIENMFQYFNKEQFHFLILEKFNSNPKTELTKIAEFLEIDNNFINKLDFKKLSNKTKYPKFPLLQFPVTLYKKYLKNHIPGKFFDSIVNKVESVNFTNERPSVSEKYFNDLKESFNPEIKKLENLINEDLSCWKY